MMYGCSLATLWLTGRLARRWGGDVRLANREGGGAVATISFDRA